MIKHWNFGHIIVLMLIWAVPMIVYTQEVRVIDNKGTKVLVKNTSVSTGTTAPLAPVQNDIWIDTSDADHQRVKVWNGSEWAELTFTGISGSIFFAGPDGVPTQDNNALFWDAINERLGLGTSSPTQSLDVNGYARIRSMDEAATMDQLLKADSNGVLHTSKVNFGGRWTNTNTTENLNVTNTVVPIFGSNDYVDDGTNLYEVSGNTLIVKEAGRYDIRVNITLEGVDDSLLTTTEFDTNVNVRLAINGTPIGSFGATGHISFDNFNNFSSVHLNDILELGANDVITIISYREANSGTVRLYSSGTSSFVINKLR
ncbi:hypothetical protein PP180_16655 [Muricauda sp. SK9]|uniref:hypothetical protein n=1 Tax=Flavobacteriaceae TaxID=49546 RepID=UPI0011C426B0|nr:MULTISPECIES: hypothetical protein [Allomuricauda]MDC6387014.1 hypothetical protein [Muricauda sp. SK9]